MAKEVLLDELNTQQREAILYSKGPLLVLAGAGSGKTRVISHKFAYLAKKKKFHPSSILTVTSSNRAASEMKERICKLADPDLKNAWIGTFHALCNRILRKEIKVLGYRADFTIYDEDDQCCLVRNILRDFNMYEALYKGVASRISLLKAACISPEEFLAQGDGFSFDEKLGRIYFRYQDELRRCNALDNDDLTMLTARLFTENAKILRKYCDSFPYLLIDDFQDINPSQYRLIQLLTQMHSCICAAGDDNQSILKSKGADINNILNFERDFHHAKVIHLEQNYRSTKNILNASSSVIVRNAERKTKDLWTDKLCGDKVFFCRLGTEEEEAKYVARTIKDLYLRNDYDYRSFAILYRINLQARALEDALSEEGIPYHMTSCVSFYQRREIKDLLSYMKVALNNNDNVSLRRIINCPPRGVGPSTLTKIEQEAKKNDTGLFQTVKLMLKTNAISPSLKAKLGELVEIVEKLKETSYRAASDMLKDIIEKTAYLDEVEDDRLQNILELVASAENVSVNEFSDRVSLSMPTDDPAKGHAVSLMPLHCAKGAEFPVVFITGLEEGILPYFKAVRDDTDVQEERRLFYVGMTRARDVLCLTSVRKRKLYSRVQEQELSQFLSDIPKECCNWVERVCRLSEGKTDTVKSLPKKPASFYVVGCRVKHPSWGIGVVRDCCGEGDDVKVTVNFPTVGLKRLATRFANLVKV
ncbi:MAG TPA: DUF3553 domain-containing protein [Dissulfurispiraceae bacterium]|nr:DUF3553 domain-containing protein [Dissulfurispiraceae bacterium]